MNKEQKIELLEKIKDKIPDLKKKSKKSPEFKAWLSQSELIISKVFIEEPEYSKKFKNIRYSLRVFFADTPDYEFQQAYEKGLDEAYTLIDSYIENVEIFDSISTNKESDKEYALENNERKNSNKIFIVHGRDNEAKLEVARFLEKLNLKPIILHEQASEGKTIIEKIESYTDVGYAIVLYTPCDIGGLKGTNNEELKDRARQNVVFEHGYLIGKIGRNKVSALIKGNIETPNDISGVVYINMSGSWEIDLAKELKSAGYKIDFNSLF